MWQGSTSAHGLQAAGAACPHAWPGKRSHTLPPATEQVRLKQGVPYMSSLLTRCYQSSLSQMHASVNEGWAGGRVLLRQPAPQNRCVNQAQCACMLGIALLVA